MTRGMLLITGLGFAVAAGAASAQGFDPSRLYLKGFGGLEFAQDASVDVETSLPLDLSFDLGYDTGYVLGAAAGYRVTDRVAVELEYAYRRADATVDVHFIDFGGDEPFEGSDSFDDRVVVQSGMVNLLYQFDGIGPAAISPYVGGGIGAATVDVRGEGSADPAFAWQAIAGVSYPIDTRWSLNGEVRWFSTDGGSFLDEGDALTLDLGYEAIDVIFGATYRF